MIQDLHQVPEGAIFESDVCIAGAGVAGITLGLSLAERGISVLLLESGGERVEAETQALYQGDVVDPSMHSPPGNYRQRRLGGSSGIWGGRCVPYDASDFEERPWIAESGWPLNLEDLLPYYGIANKFCEAGRFSYTAEDAFPKGSKPIIRRFQGAQFSDNTLERFSCPTDFGQRYRRRLATARDIRVLLHANVTEIISNSDGRVEKLVVKTLDGRTFSSVAKRFVLAMGGLEIPRLLLSSRGHHSNGVGNQHDWVGRTYMCHIAGTIGSISTTVRGSAAHGYEVSQDGVYCRRRFALKPEAQRQLRVGNFIARLHHPRIPDPSHRTGFLSALFLMKPFISYEYRKRLHGDGSLSPSDTLRHVRNLAVDSINTAGTLAHWIRRRTLAERKFPSIIVQPKSGVYSLDFNAEQEPNRDSRVSLVTERDRLGMQRVSVDWRHTAGDMRTVREAIGALASDLRTSGCAELAYDPEEVEFAATRDGAYGGHHIGTTRMAASPKRGVVDPNCRVHGTTNLFVAGSSVFPTSSQANPTLTIVAMALRLAAHLQYAR